MIPDYITKFQSPEAQSATYNDLKSSLKNNLSASLEFRRVENVGPKVSSELLRSGVIAISLSLFAMLLYIWIRFEWQFSLGAIVALFHDVILTLGIFSVFSLEINLSIVAAVLTIVGYSMNDTVVIYDRVRDNLRRYVNIKIFELSNTSINETLSRTIITSLTTLLALLSIYLFGGEILKGFFICYDIRSYFWDLFLYIYCLSCACFFKCKSENNLREDKDKKLSNFLNFSILIKILKIDLYSYL